jgi:hypothetical protein
MNTQRLLLPLLLVAICATACVSRTQRSPAISGNIIDSNTRAPLAGTRVTIRPDYGPAKSTVADSAGHFVLPVSKQVTFSKIVAKEGPYMGVISFEKEGYRGADVSFLAVTTSENLGTVLLTRGSKPAPAKHSVSLEKKF